MEQKETQAKDVFATHHIETQSSTPQVDRVQPQEENQEDNQTRQISAKPAERTEQASKWAVLAILAIGIFMATLDTSIVNISLPTIARYFGVPLNGAIEWVIIAYLVVIAGVLLTTGRLADMIGHKPIWAAGLIIFTLGSAMCGFAPRCFF